VNLFHFATVLFKPDDIVNPPTSWAIGPAYFTPAAQDLFSRLKTPNGESLFRLVRNNAGAWIVMTKLDYHTTVRQSVCGHLRQQKSNDSIGVYVLLM